MNTIRAYKTVRRAFAIYSFKAFIASGVALLAIGFLAPCESDAQLFSNAEELFFAGEYEKCLELTTQIQNDPSPHRMTESWTLLQAKAQIATGQYPEAVATIEKSLERLDLSLTLRWAGVKFARLNGNPELATKWETQIQDLYAASSWNFQKWSYQLVIGEMRMANGQDAKKLLNEFFNPTRDKRPLSPEVHQAIGRLALAKYDYAYAAECFTKAIELDPKDPDSHFGLAQAIKGSDTERATVVLQKALELNPRHAPTLLQLAENLISRERYENAEVLIARIIDLNPHQIDAWCFRAVIAHLANDPKKEFECRAKALALWKDNPHVDHTIGRLLSRKYRFSESVRYQRRALVLKENYLPAKMQLAHDLLRLGNELEGWKLADEVFDADPYSVAAFNLVTLRDNIADYASIESDGFVIRMSQKEAELYGDYVLELLVNAKKELTTKYDVELETPIFIEIYPQQSDFAIRTFGMPGGAGYLGVCFGRLVTMNSPAAQGTTKTNWRSVLWHEFCHVVTLQKTKNRMPRWLSEGISVYEERLRNPAWGQSMNPRYHEMILGDDHTTISELSSAFLTPKSAIHLDFAYFEASLAIEFLVKEFGFDTLQNILADLGTGFPIDDALRRHAAPIKILDPMFTKFAREKANAFAPEVDLSSMVVLGDSVEQWEEILKEKPLNREALLGLATAQRNAEDFESSNASLQKLIEVYPVAEGMEPALEIMAANYLDLEQKEQWIETLEKLVALDSNLRAPRVELAKYFEEAEDLAKSKSYAEQILGIDPISLTGHKMLARIGEKTKDDELTIRSLSKLVKQAPIDPAGSHFRLALAYERTGQVDLAKRQTLMALEVAPRFRDAHELLLKLTKTSEQ